MDRNYIATELLTAAKEITAFGVEKSYHRSGSDFVISVKGSVGGASVGNFDKLARMYNSVRTKIEKALYSDIRANKIVGSIISKDGFVVENGEMYAVVIFQSDDETVSDGELASLGYKKK